MKRFFQLLVLLAFVSVSASAQGNLFVGGQLSFSSNDLKNSFTVSPNLGYRINEHMVLVGAVGFTSGTTDKDLITETKISGFGIGAEFRYGWMSGDNVFWFLAPGVNFGSSKETKNDVDTKSTNFGIALRPGISYQMSDKWSVTSHFGSLAYDSVKPEKGDALNTFGLNLDLDNIDFGLSFHF